MSLLTRLSHTSANEEEHIGVQEFYAALILYANGAPGIDQTAIKARWGVTDPTDITQFNAIVDSFMAARSPSYGGLYQDSIQPVQVIPNNTVTALDALQGASAMASSGMTVDTANGNLVLPLAGDYMVSWQLSFSGTANTTYDVSIYGGASTEADGTKAIRRLGAGGDVGSVSGSALITTPAANVPINLRIVHAGGGDRDVTVHAIQMYARSMQTDNKALWECNFHAVLLLAEAHEFGMDVPATTLVAMQAGE